MRIHWELNASRRGDQPSHSISNEPETNNFVCTSPCLPDVQGSTVFGYTDAVVRLTTIVTPSLVNEVRSSLNRSKVDANENETVTATQVGMTPMQAIQAATANAAEALGRQADVGAIAVGRYGDLIAVAGDPLADVSQLQSVAFVMKGGEIVKAPYPEGNLLVATVRDPAGNVIGLWQEAPR